MIPLTQIGSKNYKHTYIILDPKTQELDLPIKNPPRSNASTQVHLGLHFTHWSNCNQKYNKQNQETNTPMLCRFDNMLLDSSKTHHGRINYQSSWICTWMIFQNAQYLCDSQKALSQKETVVIYQFSPDLKQILKPAFIQLSLLSLMD